MQNIKLIISYDGTNYHGWQRQENAITIQEVIEKACSKLFSENITIRGAGRTDTGVHALGQCATLMVDTSIPLERLPLALNRILPPDIVITHAEKVSMDFHPQYSAKSKTYRYQIMNGKYPVPQMRHYAHFVYQPLNHQWMDQAAKHFVGTHDFTTFCSAGTDKVMKERTIYSASVARDGDMIAFEICGNGFLYNMVRIMVGTLIQVGKGKKSPNSIPDIILSKNRKSAGMTAPPHGLTMYNIEY